MRIAFLHLAYLPGKITENRSLIERAVEQACQLGAEWIITPECAVSGYSFYDQIGTAWVTEQPDCWMEKMRSLTKQKKITLFLGTPERDAVTGHLFNSLFVLGPDGSLLGRHRKQRVVGRAEAWATAGTELEPIVCDEVKVGLLICADSWHSEKVQILREKGAQLLLVCAAWPQGTCGPGTCWEEKSWESGLPLFVCNQTGNHGSLDFRKADSAVVQYGRRLLEQSLSEGAILLFDWDMAEMSLISEAFTSCDCR